MIRLLAAVAATLLLAACTTGGGDSGSTQNAWATFQSRFIDGAFARDPAFAASQGRHEFDGKLPDWSEEALAEHAAFLQSAIDAAQTFPGLDDRQRFERDYLVSVARGQLFWLKTADQPHTNPAY